MDIIHKNIIAKTVIFAFTMSLFFGTQITFALSHSSTDEDSDASVTTVNSDGTTTKTVDPTTGNVDSKVDSTTGALRPVKVDSSVNSTTDAPQPVKALNRIKSFGSNIIKSSDDRHSNDEDRALDAKVDLKRKAADLERRKIELRQDVAEREDKLRRDIERKKANLSQVREDGTRISNEELENRRAELDAKKDARTEAIEDRQAKRRVKIDEAAKKRIEAYVARVVKRMNAAVTRLSDLLERVNSRTDKLEERGADISEVKRLENVASTKISEAGAAVADITQSVRDALSSEDTTAQRNTINEKFRVAKEAIIEAHKAIVDVVRELKASAGNALDSNSSADDTDAN